MPLENVIETTENCRHSLMCRHMCPVGNLTHQETLTPHGWAQLIASERRGIIEWNEDTVEALYQCADCGLCRSHCATDQPLPAAIAAARQQVMDAGRAPERVEELAEKLRSYENPYLNKPPREVDGEGADALFVGDVAAHRRPEAADAVERLLGETGSDPVRVGAGRNNGLLASSLGCPDLAAKLVGRTLEELQASGAKRMFVLSPGDYFVFNRMAEERLGVEWPGDVELLEVGTYLEKQLREGSLSFRPLEENGPVAYVDPTHTVRVKSRLEAPRNLLKSLLPADPIELFWRRERAFPCGDLALEFTSPELADDLTRHRLDDATERGAEVLVTEGPGSVVHLREHAGEYDCSVQGLYELLAEQIA